MTNSEKHEETRDCTQAISRRTLLKFAAGAPLVLTFGMLASPLARFLKPTMEPGEFFQRSDFPASPLRPTFTMRDFPEDWLCIPFIFEMRYVVFSPQREEIRSIPGIALRIGDEIVAFSRICPQDGSLLRYKSELCCGCVNSTVGSCNCASKKRNPVLVCPKHHSTFDLLQGGRIVNGREPRPPRHFKVVRNGEQITIKELEIGSIA